MNFTMNLSRNLMLFLTIFVGIKETISDELWLSNQNYFKAALPLIQKRNLTLKLAIPHKYERGHAAYLYDGMPNKKKPSNPEISHCVACPAPQDGELITTTERNLKITGKLSEDSKLFIMQDHLQVVGSECSANVTPSIEKAKKKDGNGNLQYCGHSEAELYDVGYPVLKENKKDVQFMSMYQVCYSKDENKGTQYTIHRISSPNLLLRELWEYYEPNLTKLFKSSLDKTNRIKSDENYYAYQLVGFQDMLINPWELTTLFDFNHTLIPKNEDLLMGMIAADNYIRLYSKKTNKPLTLYSGAYEVMETIPSFIEMIVSFWRIIMDDEGNGVIIVTQPTQSFFFCNENPVIVREYDNGGCTYICLIDENIIKLLGLPKLEINKTLDLTLYKEVPIEAKKSLLGQQPTSSYSQTMDISDFMEKGKFMSALKEVDAKLAKKIIVELTTKKPWIYCDIPEPKTGNASMQDEEDASIQDDEDASIQDDEDASIQDDEDASIQDDEDASTQNDEDTTTKDEDLHEDASEEEYHAEKLGARRKM